MRIPLSYLVFLHNTIIYDVLCHERLLPQVKTSLRGVQVDSSSLATSLNHPFEVQQRYPRYRYDHANQQQAEKEQLAGIPKFNPHPEPFGPASLGTKMKLDGNPTQQGKNPTSLHAPSSAVHQNYGLQDSYHQKSYVEAREERELPMEINEDVALRVSDGFPRVAELRSWFNNKVLQIGWPENPDLPTLRRRKFKHAIAGYVRAYPTFYAMPAIEGNQIIPKQKKVLEEGFLATYEFGRHALNTYWNKDPKLIEKLDHGLNAIKKDFSTSKPLEDDDFEKILCWPIILTAARERFYWDASKFSAYLWKLRESYPEDEVNETLWNKSFQRGKNLEFKTLFLHRKPQLEAIGRMLGYEEREGRMDKWWNYVKKICDNKAYHEINIEIEQRVKGFSEEERLIKVEDADLLVSSTLSRNHNQWQLDPLTVTNFFDSVLELASSGDKSIMGFELARDCLDYFSLRLLQLTKHLAKNIGMKDHDSEVVASGKLLKILYSSRIVKDSTSGNKFPDQQQ